MIVRDVQETEHVVPWLHVHMLDTSLVVQMWMNGTTVLELDHSQSIWLDYVHRRSYDHSTLDVHERPRTCLLAV